MKQLILKSEPTKRVYQNPNEFIREVFGTEILHDYCYLSYQFSASAEGWRDAKTFIIHNINHAIAIMIAYQLAGNYNTETRTANCTGYESLGRRHFAGEVLGNGCYCRPNNAANYVEDFIGLS